MSVVTKKSRSVGLSKISRKRFTKIKPLFKPQMAKGKESSSISVASASDKEKSYSNSHLASDTYRYSQLSTETSIRVLKLHPAFSDTEAIYCELLEIDDGLNVLGKEVTSHEGYEALSWCWGKQEKKEEILLQEEERIFSFHVSPTLNAALRAIRLTSHARFLWVDAICINQENGVEKSRQVARMDQIFAQAKNVVIWLGEGDENSKLAMDFINGGLLSMWEFDKFYEDPKYTRHWSAMASLMQRPWFLRRWVLQEIALAKSGTLQCGSETIPWRDFADAVSLLLEKERVAEKLTGTILNYNTFGISESSRPFSSLGAAILVGVVNGLFHRQKGTGEEFKPLFSLEYLVSALYPFEATEPRDTIYALLSLASDAARKSDGSIVNSAQRYATKWSSKHVSRQHYIVDYQKPYHDVCKDFILFCIRRSAPTNALDILCRPWAPQPGAQRKHRKRSRFGGGPRIESELECSKQPANSEIMPSWIPALDEAPLGIYDHPVTGPRPARKNANFLVGLTFNSPVSYKAAGDLPIKLNQIRFTKGKNYHSMFVSGFIIDEIKQIAEPSRLGNIPESWLDMGGWSTSTTDPPDELWRTLVADQGLSGSRCPTTYARACKSCFEWILERGIPGGTFDTARIIDGGSSSIVSEFLTKVQSVIWNQCLARSSEGRLGLVPEGAVDGDLVCVLYGCSVPVILRRVKKSDAQIMLEEKFARDLWTRPGLEKAAISTQRFWRQRMKQTKSTRFSRWERFYKRTRDIMRYVCFVILAVELFFWQPRSLNLLLSSWHPGLLQYLVYKLILVFILMLILLPSLIRDPISSLGKRARLIIHQRAMIKPGRHKSKIDEKDMQIPREFYQLVGACYLHGMMDGEAIQFQNENHIATQSFEIR